MFSCSSKKNITEFIQLSHDNIMVIGGNKLTITLIPTTKKSKRSVTVKIFKNGENYDRKKITYREYNNIWNTVKNEINKEPDSSISKNYLFGVLDGVSNSIILKKDSIQMELINHKDKEERYKNFFEVAEPIVKAAGISIKEIY